MFATLDKKENFKDELLEYLKKVDFEILKKYLDEGITLKFCMINMLAINVKLPNVEHKLIFY